MQVCFNHSDIGCLNIYCEGCTGYKYLVKSGSSYNGLIIKKFPLQELFILVAIIKISSISSADIISNNGYVNVCESLV